MGTILVSLLSGLIGAVLATYLNSHLFRKHHRLSLKRDVLVRLVGNRHLFIGSLRTENSEPFVSLNQAFVVFEGFGKRDFRSKRPPWGNWHGWHRLCR